MLPLWILDITKKSKRRDEFLELISQIDHVFIERSKADKMTPPLMDDSESKVEYNASVEEDQDYAEQNANVKLKRTREEELEEEDKKKAAREAVINGNYWYYTDLSYDDFFGDVDVEDTGQIERIAKRLYFFQETVVRKAKDFIDELRASNIRPYQTINIVVLGDVTERLTHLVFASIAALLQKEKGRFLPGHIHQGMCVFGMLYVPCDINTRKVEERAKMLKLFNEIEVQHNISAIRGYDYMLLYQDVQNRTECSYPRLDEKGQAEYLLQCLVHLFLACDANHPLIHGTGSDEAFYMSMGAASVFFDMSYEDKNDTNRVAYEILNSFKEEGDHSKPDQTFRLVDKELYRVDKFVKQVNVDRFDIDDTEELSPKPHPIRNFLHRNLKKLYYLNYLRYYPAELLRGILQRTEEATGKQLDEISAYCQRSFKESEASILPSLTQVISKVNMSAGGLPTIEYLFKNLQEQMSKEKADVQQAIEREYWHKIIYEIPIIPSDECDHFEEYHDAYVNDVKNKNDGAGCDNMKKTVMSRLKNLLSKEKTMLSTLSRCFFLGIMLVLGILPVLDFLSPRFINLGNVYDNAFWWAVGLFMVPLGIQFVLFFLYLRKKASCVRVLKAYYKHDAYSRIANRIEFEAVGFYDKMIALCDEYLNRCKRIRREVSIAMPSPEARTVFPISMFNQPLNGGHFGDDYLIPTKEVEGCRIRVNYTPRFVNELEKEHYFMLINFFNDEIAVLFQDVALPEKHARRFDDKIGDYVFVSPEELQREREEKWESLKQDSVRQLIKGIKGEMIPREQPTVGEKLVQYRKKIDKFDLLEPMIAYAATNGEITSQSDTEFADVKVNIDIDDMLSRYLPLYTTRLQTAKYDELYQKLIFVTRWRCFGHFSFNRILPKEDFDQEMRRIRVYQEELEPDDGAIATSSLILWAICPDNNSSEWLKLFDASRFSESYEYRKIVRKIMNPKD